MEYITANGMEYAVKTVTTSTNQIRFAMVGQQIGDVEAVFRQATDLIVSGEDKTTYGTYCDLLFESATVSKDGSVTVVMRIPTAQEIRMAKLEAAVADHDAAIAEMYGGEAV